MGCTACLVCLPLVLELNTYMYQNEGTIKINKSLPGSRRGWPRGERSSRLCSGRNGRRRR
jgi:hypothetical protein